MGEGFSSPIETKATICSRRSTRQIVESYKGVWRRGWKSPLPYLCCRMSHHRLCESSHRNIRGISRCICLHFHSWPRSWCSVLSIQIWIRMWPLPFLPSQGSLHSSSRSGYSPGNPAGRRHHLGKTESTVQMGQVTSATAFLLNLFWNYSRRQAGKSFPFRFGPE